MSGLGGQSNGLRTQQRQGLSFRAVNRSGTPDYDPGLQRHHILPRQLLHMRCFNPMLKALGRKHLCFDDFRRNGLLLPANDLTAVRIGLPLHRGPHRTYNELVIERVGQIEASWSGHRQRAPDLALVEALQRLQLLQQALRRRLLNQQRRMRLSRKDPLGLQADFAELDAMAALLWPATAEE